MIGTAIKTIEHDLMFEAICMFSSDAAPGSALVAAPIII